MNLRQFFTKHRWWGKIIGAGLGYLIAGPIGALFGILIGNFFDRGLAEHFGRPHWHFHAEKNQDVQALFFETTFAIMGHLAKADGKVTEREVQMALQLMQEMNLNRAQKAIAKRCFNDGKKLEFNLTSTLSLLKNAIQNNQELLKLFIEIQYRAALVDGLSYKKQLTFNTILSYLGFAPLNEQFRYYEDFLYRSSNQQQSSSSNQESRYQSVHNSFLEQAFTILEVSPTADKQTVKHAYRRLISRNHPDKLIAKGLPDSVIKKANEKTQQIRKAYEQICQSKGW